MIKCFEDQQAKCKYRVIFIIVKDKLYNFNCVFKIKFIIKNNKTVDVSLNNISNNLLSYCETSCKRIPEFEIAFSSKYTDILKNALDFHKKKYHQETILHKIVNKYNIFNINGV